MQLDVLRYGGRQRFVVDGDGFLDGLETLGRIEGFGDAGIGQRGKLQRPPLVQTGGRGGKVGKGGAQQFAFRARIAREGIEELVQVLRSAGLVHKRQHQSAAGGLVNRAGQAVHLHRRGFDDLLDAIDFTAAEQRGKHRAGRWAGTEVQRVQHASHDPVRQQQASFRRLDLLMIAQDALGEQRTHHLLAQILRFQSGAFIDRHLQVKAAKAQLGDRGGNGRAFRLRRLLARVQHHDDRQHPRLLVIEHLPHLLGNLLTARGHRAPGLKHFPMHDELPARAGGAGDGQLVRRRPHARHFRARRLLGHGFQHLHFAGGITRCRRSGGWPRCRLGRGSILLAWRGRGCGSLRCLDGSRSFLLLLRQRWDGWRGGLPHRKQCGAGK